MAKYVKSSCGPIFREEMEVLSERPALWEMGAKWLVTNQVNAIAATVNTPHAIRLTLCAGAKLHAGRNAVREGLKKKGLRLQSRKLEDGRVAMWAIPWHGHKSGL